MFFICFYLFPVPIECLIYNFQGWRTKVLLTLTKKCLITLKDNNKTIPPPCLAAYFSLLELRHPGGSLALTGWTSPLFQNLVWYYFKRVESINTDSKPVQMYLTPKWNNLIYIPQYLKTPQTPHSISSCFDIGHWSW